MIPANDLLGFLMAVPKCYLDKPDDAGCQYVFDKNGDRVAHIHWGLNEIVIYDDYKHKKEVCDTIRKMTGKPVIVVDRQDSDKAVMEDINKNKERDDWLTDEEIGLLYDPPEPEPQVEDRPQAPMPHQFGDDDLDDDIPF